MSMDHGSFRRFPGILFIGPQARTLKRLWKAQVIGRFLVAVPVCLGSSLLWAGYSSMCSSYASELESGAAKYNQAKSELDSAQHSLEMACGPFGYSREDKFLCGPSGHHRQDYRNAAQEVEDATKLINSAMSEVASSCVRANEEQKSAKANAELKKMPSPFENNVRR
jgi:hypothetical protein